MFVIPEKNWGRIWLILRAEIKGDIVENGFTDVVLGLSGGMDSSLVAALAVDALGKDHVHGVLMPSEFSSEGSVSDAELLAKNLGIQTFTLPIAPLMKTYKKTLAQAFRGTKPDVTEENLQSRIRGTLLMALSNKFRWLLLATGNKSELATGYCTMYGDLCGGLAPIGDIYKTEVYKLAEYYNKTIAQQEVIPQNVFTKAPSAELRPGQVDQDSLPPYNDLDRILYLLIEEDYPIGKISESKIPEISTEKVQEVSQMIHRTAFKRKQAPSVIIISPRTVARYDIDKRYQS